MKKAICLYEDSNWASLNPLVNFCPVYELRCGILTLKEKIEKYFQGIPVLIHSRSYLSETIIGQNYNNILFDSNYSDEWIFINGKVVADPNFLKYFESLTNDFVLVNDNTVLGAYLKGENVKLLFNKQHEFFDFSQLKKVEEKYINTKFIKYPWDLVKYNGEEIFNDYNLISKTLEINRKNFEGVQCKNRNNIHIGNNCDIEPFVFLNADKGPIFIDDNCKIYSNTGIEGPCYIGKNSSIKMGSKIYHNTSIGPVCKVGGEIENSIIHSYSNKQHHGFLGNSYLGQWINLGAGTTNSDLKNNYSRIRVNLNSSEINTEMIFLGLLMGDYCKTAINTKINTGSIIGSCCNIFSDQVVPKYLPSFTWVNNNILTEYDLDKIIETTKVVYSRRGIIFTDNDRRLFKEVFNLTKPDRNY